MRIVEWEVQEKGWPLEKPAPKQLDSNQVTVLFIYGNLFYASAENFEKSLPAVEGSRRAAVILILRGYEDVGSTINEVFRRYAATLRANDGRLILAGVSSALREQFRRTGTLALIGDENVFSATDTIGESGNAALKFAQDWVEEFSREN
jgi:sulfate permease, SulP family